MVRALDAAGIASHGTEPERLLRLEPIATCGLGGWRAEFRDTHARSFAGAILVASPTELPWLDRALFDWESGRPGLVAGLLAPGLANLYVVGLGTSGLPIERSHVIVSLIRAQRGLKHPLVDQLMKFIAPSHDAARGRMRRRLNRRMQRALRPVGTSSWWEAARDLEGPLNASRGT